MNVNYSTQMDAAKKGIITPQMAIVAGKEKMEPQRLRELAFLNAGVRIKITDDRSVGKAHDFFYEGGVNSFVEYLNRAKTALHQKPIYFKGERGGVEMEVSIQYNDTYDEKIFSFANNINTHEGGTHLAGFKAALTRTMPEVGWRLVADALAHIQIRCLAHRLASDGLGQETTQALFGALSRELPKPQWEQIMAQATQAVLGWQEASRDAAGEAGAAGQTLH